MEKSLAIAGMYSLLNPPRVQLTEEVKAPAEPGPDTAIRIRRARDSDRQSWDDYVLSHPLGGAYHLFAWKQAVERAYHHQCVYLMAQDGQGAVRGVFPLVLMKPPLLKPVLVSLPFCDYGGVLSDGPEASGELVVHALELSEASSAEPDIRCVQPVAELDGSPYFAVSNRKVRMVLDLPGSAEELWQGLRSKLRSQVRSPEKEGMQFRLGSLDLVDEFYTVFRRNMKDLGSPVHARQWFERVLEAFGERARVGAVFYRGRAVAAGMVLECGRTLTIPWASTLREYNHLSPNMLLYWGFLEHACESGFSRFDFGRSTPDEGTYRFKQQWGARPEPLFWYSPAVGVVKPAPVPGGDIRKLAEKAWSMLPQAVADTLGPRVRRFISL